MKILNVMWFHDIGIVQVDNDFGDINYYIGKHSGKDPEADAKHIAYWGSTFPPLAGAVLFGDTK